MNDLVDINKLLISNTTQVELIPTLFSFFMCVIMSFIVRDFYIKRSFSLTGKMHIGSIDELAEKMIWFIENSEKIEPMGIESRRIVVEKFDVHKINAKMLEIMRL